MFYEVKMRAIIGDMYSFAEEMLRVSIFLQQDVIGIFNDIELKVSPTSTIKDICIEYEQAIRRSREK